jgi:hypothetical protein
MPAGMPTFTAVIDIIIEVWSRISNKKEKIPDLESEK